LKITWWHVKEEVRQSADPSLSEESTQSEKSEMRMRVEELVGKAQ
jgi:hypothetical protein